MLFSSKKVLCKISFKDNIRSFEVEKTKDLNFLLELFIKSYNNKINFKPYIKLSSKNYPFEEEEMNQKLMDILSLSPQSRLQNSLTFEITKDYKCSCCQKNYIEKYCLVCLKFLCVHCGKNQCNNHKKIDISAENLSDSIKEYTIGLNAEISDIYTKIVKQENFISDDLYPLRVKYWRESLEKTLENFDNYIKAAFKLKRNLQKCYEDMKININELISILNKNIKKVNDELSTKKTVKEPIYFSLDECEKILRSLNSDYSDIINYTKKCKIPIFDKENIKEMNEKMKISKSILEDLCISAQGIFRNLKKNHGIEADTCVSESLDTIKGVNSKNPKSLKAKFLALELDKISGIKSKDNEKEDDFISELNKSLTSKYLFKEKIINKKSKEKMKNKGNYYLSNLNSERDMEKKEKNMNLEQKITIPTTKDKSTNDIKTPSKSKLSLPIAFTFKQSPNNNKINKFKQKSNVSNRSITRNGGVLGHSENKIMLLPIICDNNNNNKIINNKDIKSNRNSTSVKIENVCSTSKYNNKLNSNNNNSANNSFNSSLISSGVNIRTFSNINK